jgi:hypothetical protein
MVRGAYRSVYDWFTEGFDTRDLKEAKALLGELGSRESPDAPEGLLSSSDPS